MKEIINTFNQPEILIGILAMIGLLAMLWSYAKLLDKGKKGHRHREIKGNPEVGLSSIGKVYIDKNKVTQKGRAKLFKNNRKKK